MRPLPTLLFSAVHHVVRSQARLPSFFRARLQRDGAPDLKISIMNVSRSGFMGEASDHVAAGSPVRLILPFGSVITADVRWSLNRRVGCQLRGKFTLRQFMLLLLSTPRSFSAEFRMVAVSAAALIIIVLV
jgi:hypothetical protein